MSDGSQGVLGGYSQLAIDSREPVTDGQPIGLRESVSSCAYSRPLA